jgi:UDP-3-O-[3-hydroxymyristoyl] glucosamine N-acyltransferase
MAEPTFFSPAATLTIAEIAELTGARLSDGADRSLRIAGVGPLDLAGPGDVSFLESASYLPHLAGTRATACFHHPKFAGRIPAGVIGLETGRPHRAFTVLAGRLFPMALRPQAVTGVAGISPAAHVAPDARIEPGATVEAGAVVGPGAEIGSGTLVGPGTIVGPGVRIGRDAAIAGNVTILYALLGNRVAVHSGTRIGQDGFGYVPEATGHLKVPQLGRVVIQDDVEIGANSCIDRGSGRDTVIGEGSKIDNLVQIGHNTVLGRHCIVAGSVGISGSVVLEDFVMLAGGVGVRDHLRIGRGAKIGAAAIVLRDVPAGETWFGYPAAPMVEWRRERRALLRVMKQAVPTDAEGGDGE